MNVRVERQIIEKAVSAGLAGEIGGLHGLSSSDMARSIGGICPGAQNGALELEAEGLKLINSQHFREGAADYIEAAGIFLSMQETYLAAGAYVYAGTGYWLAGDSDKEGTYYQKAANQFAAAGNINYAQETWTNAAEAFEAAGEYNHAAHAWDMDGQCANTLGQSELADWAFKHAGNAMEQAGNAVIASGNQSELKTAAVDFKDAAGYYEQAGDAADAYNAYESAGQYYSQAAQNEEAAGHFGRARSSFYDAIDMYNKVNDKENSTLNHALLSVDMAEFREADQDWADAGRSRDQAGLYYIRLAEMVGSKELQHTYWVDAEEEYGLYGENPSGGSASSDFNLAGWTNWADRAMGYAQMAEQKANATK